MGWIELNKSIHDMNYILKSAFFMYFKNLSLHFLLLRKLLSGKKVLHSKHDLAIDCTYKKVNIRKIC